MRNTLTYEYVVSCPLCQGSAVVIATDMPDYSCPCNEIFEYAECTRCTLIFLSKRPPQKESARHYRSDYQPYVENYTRVARLVIAMRTKREVALFRRYHPSAQSVLDVGCSRGTYLSQLRHYGGFKVLGIEMDKKSCETGRSQLHLDIRHGEFLTTTFSEQFDIISMNHVIEHLYQPLETIQRVHELLSPSGLFVVKTPNPASVERTLFRRYWFPLEAPRHTLLFSPQVLGKVLEDHGFTIRHIGYDMSPINLIMSLHTYCVSRAFPPAVTTFFSIDNYLLLFVLTPFSFLLSLLKQSGRYTFIAQKSAANTTTPV